MRNIFTQHPNTIGETYWQHMFFAFTFGFKMLVGGLACLIHAIFPFLFEKTGSDILLNIVQEFVKRMPADENRINVLSRCIEKKINKI